MDLKDIEVKLALEVKDLQDRLDKLEKITAEVYLKLDTLWDRRNGPTQQIRPFGQRRKR